MKFFLLVSKPYKYEDIQTKKLELSNYKVFIYNSCFSIFWKKFKLYFSFSFKTSLYDMSFCDFDYFFKPYIEEILPNYLYVDVFTIKSNEFKTIDDVLKLSLEEIKSISKKRRLVSKF